MSQENDAPLRENTLSEHGPVSYGRLENIGVIRVANPPVNALGEAVRAGLWAAIQEASADDETVGIVLIGDGNSFPAGADIKEFGQPMGGVDLNDINALFEQAPKPVVAAIHGTALGGGLELALSCHYRVIAKGSRLGLPEVNLGLLPGAGGTQRLPRLVGQRAALQIMTSGKGLRASLAVEMGIADELIEGDLLESAGAFAQEKAEQGEELPVLSQRTLASAPDVIEAFQEQLKTWRPGAAVASKHIVEAVAAASDRPFEEGLAEERRLFELCRQSPQSPALIHAFFAERAARKVPFLGTGTRPYLVNKVGVIGGGTMGAGIAIACAANAYDVVLVDSSEEALQRCEKAVEQHFSRLVEKKRMPAKAAETACQRISLADDLQALADVELVIEAVFEDMDLKKEIFAKLPGIVGPDCVLASNTSTLDIDVLAEASGVPDRVLGLHFFSPAPVMQLLEVVKGDKTSPKTLATGLTIAKWLKKTGVVSGVCDGFIGNRMIDRYLHEATMMLEEGALPHDVDQAIQKWGFAMGPFTMSDLAGNDVGWRIQKQRGPLPPEKGRTSNLLNRLCEEGRFGQKTGKGWYDYPEGPRKPKPSTWVAEMIEDESAQLQMERTSLDAKDIRQRLLLALINEGLQLLDEGIAIRASDIDLVYLTGYGFPRFKGGPLYQAEVWGLPAVLNKLQDLEKQFGSRWKPAPLLEYLVAQDKPLSAVLEGKRP
ncbi:3-hydroxyacyl-CoA dehydrogenase NAD-binding domain-containing protein [Rhodovibrionaceae bacterium A322]